MAFTKIGIFICGALSLVFQVVAAYSKPDYMQPKATKDEEFEKAKAAGLRVCESCNVRKEEEEGGDPLKHQD